MTEKKIELKFAPGCFDSFDGTQEELDELIAELQALADSGELFSNATKLDEKDAEEVIHKASKKGPLQ
jgi:hypothetical protein